MNLQMIFRVNGAILFINGLSFLLLTETFLGMAGFNMTPSLQTLAAVSYTHLRAHETLR